MQSLQGLTALALQSTTATHTLALLGTIGALPVPVGEVDCLIELCANEDAKVRRRAFEILRQHGSPSQKLFDVSRMRLSDCVREVRTAARHCLARFGTANPELVTAHSSELIQLLDAVTETGATGILEALAGLEKPTDDVFEAALKYLNEHRSAAVHARIGALKILAKFPQRNAEIVAALVTIFRELTKGGKGTTSGRYHWDSSHSRLARQWSYTVSDTGVNFGDEIATQEVTQQVPRRRL